MCVLRFVVVLLGILDSVGIFVCDVCMVFVNFCYFEVNICIIVMFFFFVIICVFEVCMISLGGFMFVLG